MVEFWCCTDLNSSTWMKFRHKSFGVTCKTFSNYGVQLLVILLLLCIYAFHRPFPKGTTLSETLIETKRVDLPLGVKKEKTKRRSSYWKMSNHFKEGNNLHIFEPEIPLGTFRLVSLSFFVVFMCPFLKRSLTHRSRIVVLPVVVVQKDIFDVKMASGQVKVWGVGPSKKQKIRRNLQSQKNEVLLALFLISYSSPIFLIWEAFSAIHLIDWINI